MSFHQRTPPTEAEKQQFLALLALGVSVSSATKCTGHVRSTWYKLCKTDELFRTQWLKERSEAGRFEIKLAGAIYHRILLEIKEGKNFWPAIRFAIANFELGFVDPEVTVKREVNLDKTEIKAESEAYRKAIEAGRIANIEDAGRSSESQSGNSKLA